jgi:hypothetical protein
MGVFWPLLNPFMRGLPRQQAHKLNKSGIGPAA